MRTVGGAAPQSRTRCRQGLWLIRLRSQCIVVMPDLRVIWRPISRRELSSSSSGTLLASIPNIPSQSATPAECGGRGISQFNSTIRLLPVSSPLDHHLHSCSPHRAASVLHRYLAPITLQSAIPPPAYPNNPYSRPARPGPAPTPPAPRPARINMRQRGFQFHYNGPDGHTSVISLSKPISRRMMLTGGGAGGEYCVSGPRAIRGRLSLSLLNTARRCLLSAARHKRYCDICIVYAPKRIKMCYVLCAPTHLTLNWWRLSRIRIMLCVSHDDVYRATLKTSRTISEILTLTKGLTFRSPCLNLQDRVSLSIDWMAPTSRPGRPVSIWTNILNLC